MDLKEDMRMYVNERDALIEVERKHRHGKSSHLDPEATA
jgi:hypothetical protein